MLKSMHKIFMLTLVFSFTLMSCSKEKVKPEPVDTDTVKVFTRNIDGAIWTLISDGLIVLRTTKVTLPADITSDIIKNWVILVYTGKNNEWTLAPYYGLGRLQFNYSIDGQNLYLFLSQNGTENITPNRYPTWIRVVCIKPTSNTTFGLKTSPSINFNDYNDVRSYYGIKE